MSIKLKVKDYCQNCNQFQVDVLEVKHVTNDGYTTDTTILCKYKDKCKIIEEYFTRDRREAALRF